MRHEKGRRVELPFFTIGHSDRSLNEFIELLGASNVNCVVDVRKFPRSRSNPQFNVDSLPVALATCDISYKHMASLGGRRGKDQSLVRDVNGFWTHESFHNYADYALTEEFRAGFDRLVEEGRQQRCAIMCSEAVWWRCHRRIIADYLIAYGKPVFHIMGLGRPVPARLTPSAVIQPNGTIVYPASQQSDA